LTLRPRALEDFAERCRFHQTSPESHFTRGRICTLATPEGRITLSDLRLIVTTGLQGTERRLAAEAEYAAVLRQTFGVIE
jgi:N-hydroxyarylamine O-acetyltransferase